MKCVKYREMGPSVKAHVLLVLYLKRERKKKKEERSRVYVLCSMPRLSEIACSCKLAESAPHFLVEGYNHRNTCSVQQTRDTSNSGKVLSEVFMSGFKSSQSIATKSRIG